mmetsp:Transcript_39522/g.59734  ORF Transcript_39522/g.59734 Transcript_39522/m.59734 type:complete len:307 (+) Transcript_39522:210-1130(+)|eukprot:CAMPEP_0194751406 /NCGR_PEP_ID=MMETSP0323_2-20130528/5472_1 /TAXON_ID=2866 ORGANISM="Crypthecodinium cohnii, Strain Seligo" /NCGR_SAMPLE_ID=MMETSP0323_2 /ASSEMBLY_ACC=CAM_ASM_000346 /LENGTH=306 /DNA_ID=CAMNT_0039667889 /DNA_START=139 /DNA_END=1059 /DNA_ORIENTATION=-
MFIIILAQIVVLLVASLIAAVGWEKLVNCTFGSAASNKNEEKSKLAKRRRHSISLNCTFSRGLSSLPANILGELASMLRLDELASLSTTQCFVKDRLWECPDVWHRVAARSGIAISSSTIAAGEIRRTCRHAIFHLDGALLKSIGPRCALQVLETGKKMLQGLSPEDLEGARPVDLKQIVARAERALGDFDPEDPKLAAAAATFIEAAQNASLWIGESSMEILEHNYRSTMQLHELMTTAMETDLHNQLSQMEQTLLEDTPRRPRPPSKAYDCGGPGPLERRRLKRKEAELHKQEPKVGATGSGWS